MKETTNKSGRRFDEEFQRDAVKMLESGTTRQSDF
jgi:hypothetical protein